MYETSQLFHRKVLDETVPQDFLCIMGNCYFTGRNGDFTDQDITIDEVLCEGDISYGNATSSSISFSLNNDMGVVQGVSWGEGRCFIGVQTGSSPYSFSSGVNCHVEINGYTFEGKENGVYRNGALWVSMSGGCVSLDSFGGYLYMYGPSDCRRAKLADFTVSAFEPDSFMANKWLTGVSVVFDGSAGTVWDGETVTTWEYCPVGVFRLIKPARTAGEIVTVSNAFDRMTYLDVDASPWAVNLASTMTLGALFVSLCNYCGVGYVTNTFTNSAVSVITDVLKETAYTCREVLAFVAGRALKNVRMNRTGLVEFVDWGNEPVETLTNDRIEMDGNDIAEFVTQPITRVTLKGTNGSSISDGAAGNEYIIFGNPFFNQLDQSTITAIKALPRYIPISSSVLVADPSVDLGDLISIESQEIGNLLVDPEGKVIVNLEGVAYSEAPDKINFPLMSRTLIYSVGCDAVYTASGNEVREVDDMTRYNATVSVSEKIDTLLTQEEVFNRLTNNGQMQGLYMSGNELYINAEYIKSGYLDADRIDAGSIVIGKLSNSLQNTITTASNNASNALKTTVPIYYRSTTNSTPAAPTATSSVTNNYDTDNQWTYVMPYPKKTRYYYTCEQYTTSNGTTWSTVKAIRNANYTAAWCSSSDATCIDGGSIYTNSVTADKLVAKTLSISNFNDTDSTKINNAATNASEALTNAAAAQSTADSAQSTANASVKRSQVIYYRAASGTTSVNAPTTWVTSTSNSGGGWRTKPPQYSSSYPVLFVATQWELNNGTISSNTPAIDNTITVIDGGTIVTGSVTANQLASNAVTADKINAGAVTTAKIDSNAVTADKISVTDLNAIGATIGGFKIETDSIHTNGLAITSNSTNSIGLSTSNFTRTINNVERTGLRFAIGSRFGVAGNGTVYMSNAVVSGDITATSGSIAGSLVTSGISATNITTGQLNVGTLVADRSIAADKLVLTDVTIAASKITTGTMRNDIVFAIDSVNSATQNATSESSCLKIGSNFGIYAGTYRNKSSLRFKVGTHTISFIPEGVTDNQGYLFYFVMTTVGPEIGLCTNSSGTAVYAQIPQW